MTGAFKALLHDPESDPVKLAAALDGETAKEWRSWDPELIREYAKLSGDDVQQLDKLLAIQVLLTNPDVFEDWHLFHHVATTLNNRRASFEFFDALTYLELAWACTVARELDKNHLFGPGVIRYIGAVCLNDGLIYFPWTGGEGFDLTKTDFLRGMLDPALTPVAADLRSHWVSGAMQDLKPSSVDDTNVFHVQMAKLVSGQEFIRSHKDR